MATKRTKGRGSSLKSGFQMTGVSELLKQIEAAGGNVDAACQKAVDRSLKIVGEDMKSAMSKHVDTGDTMRSYEQVPASVEGGKITAEVGFSIKKGGLPAIFFDVGTPKIKPMFYRYYAVNNNSKQLAQIQKETLEEILGGLR